MSDSTISVFHKNTEYKIDTQLAEEEEICDGQNIDDPKKFKELVTAFGAKAGREVFE